MSEEAGTGRGTRTAGAEARTRRPVPWRWTATVAAGLAVVAVIGRLVLLGTALDGDALPVGPDAEDWVIATAGITDGDWSLLQHNRYPLFPAIASLGVRLFGLSASASLLLLSLLFSSATPAVLFVVGRRWLSMPAAVGAGLWVALAPSQLVLGVSTIAYTLFGLAFLTVLAGMLDDHRWRGPLVAGLGVAVAVATLNQGLLCLLALLPAGLLLRRWWCVAAAIGGALAGLGLVHGLHPSPASATSWMLRESMVYLSGNIPEETARVGGTYGKAFEVWAGQTFRMRGPWAAGLLALGVWGVVATTWRAHREGRPLTPTLALGWALAPAAVLVIAMGSSHHLIHLIPLAALAATLGATSVDRTRPWGGLAVAVAVAILAVVAYPASVKDLERRAEEGRSALRVGEAVVELIGDEGVIVAPPTRPGDPAEILFNVQWALPPGVTVVQLADLDSPRRIPPLEDAVGRGAHVAVVGNSTDQLWAAGPYLFTGSARSVPLPGRPGDRTQALHLVTVSPR